MLRAASARGQAPRCPGRAQGRGPHRLMRVFLADRDHLEARILQCATDIGILVEVLPVLLAERVAVTRRA